MRKRRAAAKSLSAKTCKALTEVISDYLAGQMAPRLKREFEQHLSLCPDCVSFLKTYKKTVALGESLEPSTFPTKLRDNILEFLHNKMRRIAAFWLYIASQLLA
jgi:hypothetical protein